MLQFLVELTPLMTAQQEQYELSRFFEVGSLHFDKQPAPEKILPIITEPYLSTLHLMRENAIRPDPVLTRGIALARNLTNNLRRNVGLKTVPSNEMEVILLEKDKFDSYYRVLGGLGEDEKIQAIGFSAQLLAPVVVQHHPDLPAYFLASLALHEFIHRWLELSSTVFTVKQENNVRHLSYLSSRDGLTIYKTFRKYPDISPQRQGMLLNEIPNLIFQRAFIELVLDDPNYSMLFEEEIEKRDKALAINGLSHVGYHYLNAQGYTCLLDRSLTYHNTRGVAVTEDTITPITLLQLAGDLLKIYSEQDKTTSFPELLLHAKINPRFQSRIKNIMDARMGDGFFNRLKHAKYEPADIMSILSELQVKLDFL
ncbi:hypothetical protein HY468_01100 [Candidatus Roizmanbacteria bacterium]|nr:hypothetical protein [Candidatus Roizmanbacteria bacterium]